MRTFSLSRGCAWPESVAVDGESFEINTGFRTILKCLRAFEDHELTERDKSNIVLRSFYKDKIPKDPFKHFFDFVAMGEKNESPGSGVKDFDYEIDAKEIYASFWAMYGIDLFAVNLHWWTFQILLFGAFSSDTPISEKIKIRHLDDPQSAKKANVERAKRSAKITDKISNADSNFDSVLIEKLAKGEPISDLMR